MEKLNENQKVFDKRNFYNSKDAGWAFILALFVPFAVALLVMFIGMYIGKVAGVEFADKGNYAQQLYEKKYWFTIPYMLSTQISFILVFFLYNKKNNVSFSATKFSFKIGYKNALLSIFMGIICFAGFVMLISCFDSLWVKIGLGLTESPLPLDTFGWFIVNLIVLGVIPAICEEFIFRGIIFSGLRKNFSLIPSIIISSLFFAFVHTSIQQLIYPFVMGIILALFVERTGSLFTGIIIHFTNNFITILLQYLQNVTPLDLSIKIKWWVVLIAIAVALVAGAIVYVIDRFYFKHKSKEETEVEKLPTFPVMLVVGLVVGAMVVILSTCL